jgi:hypothetical protein
MHKTHKPWINIAVAEKAWKWQTKWLVYICAMATGMSRRHCRERSLPFQRLCENWPVCGGIRERSKQAQSVCQDLSLNKAVPQARALCVLMPGDIWT